MKSIFACILLCVAVAALAKEQHHRLSVKMGGVIYGVEGKCSDLFCPDLALQLVEVGEFEEKRLFDITPQTDQPTVMEWQRFNAFDPVNSIYYFVTLYQPDEKVKGILNLFTVDIKSQNVTKVELDNSKVWNLSNMQFDQKSGTLYAAFENILTTLCPVSGNVTQLGAFISTDFVNTYASDFDQEQGRYFMHMYNGEKDSYNLVVVDVKTLNSTVGPKIGTTGDLTQVIQYMAYNPTNNKLYGVALSRMGTSVIELNADTGLWSNFIEWNNPMIQSYTARAADPVRAGLSAFDNAQQYWWVNMKESGTGGQTVLAYIDINKKWVDAGKSLSQDATNYVFVPNA